MRCRCGCGSRDRRTEPVSRSAGPASKPDLALGQALADVATIGILQERAIRRRELLNEQLQLALNSHVIIEKAKGVRAQYGALGPAAADASALPRVLPNRPVARAGVRSEALEAGARGSV
jgi:hypothetical protein